MAFNALVPTLEVENMDETIQFYESLLDFKCIDREVDAWAFIQKDDISIMLSSRFNLNKYIRNQFSLVVCIFTLMILTLFGKF